MIQFLKESTFAVNVVINKSWDLLRRHYFSVVGLCLLLFITSNASGILAFYLSAFNRILSVFMAFVFVILYFGIQLSLFKYIVMLIDEKQRISVSEATPRTKELACFFISMFLIAFLTLMIYLLVSVAGWPLIYAGVKISVMVNITLVLSTIITFLFFLRVVFYPFFIIERDASPLQAIRLSIALTKGNVTKLLLIMVFFATLHLLYLYFNYRGLPVLSALMSLMNSFLVIPLSSVVMAMAYRSMMVDYKGGEDPRVIGNII